MAGRGENNASVGISCAARASSSMASSASIVVQSASEKPPVCTRRNAAQLWLWGVISVVVIILDYILPAYFSKIFGGSKAGSWGATIGVIVGMFTMGPFGIILGPFIGAVVGEMLHQKQSLDKAIVVGAGSLLSFFVGTGLKLIVGGFMMYYIWVDAIMLIKQMW